MHLPTRSPVLSCGHSSKHVQEEFTMLESIVVIATSTCSNPSAFTIMTTDAEEIRCHEIPQIDVAPELPPELQTQ